MQKLNLSQNALEELPSGLFDSLSGLEVLDLSYNQLSILGGHILTTLSLRFVFFWNTFFKDLNVFR